MTLANTYRAIYFFLTLVFFCAYPAPAAALNVSVRIGDQYTEVAAGDRLYFHVEIKYPENFGRRDLRIEYQILEDGDVIARQKVLRAVETQLSFLDYIVMPEGAKSGTDELKVIIEDYEDLHQEASATFTVHKGINEIQIYFFILLGAIALVGLLVAVQIIATNGRRSTA